MIKDPLTVTGSGFSNSSGASYSGREMDSKCPYCEGTGKECGPFPFIPIGPIIVPNPLNKEVCRHCQGTGKRK